MKKALVLLSFFLFAFYCVGQQQADADSDVLDFLLINGTVYDGNGGEPRFVDVGIQADRIVYVGKSTTRPFAKRIIDASGLLVAPGFIDPHTHVESDLSSKTKNSNLPYLMQGVTTVFAGNDGSSPLPIGITLKKWNENGIGTNAALLVGHGTIRKNVLGMKDIQPSIQQFEEMKRLTVQAMEEGAFGISTGLFYAPGSYATLNEVIELSKIVAARGGIYDTHLRDESSYSIGLIASVNETLTIGREAGIPLHFSHIKALGKDVWGQSNDVIQLIEDAQQSGLKITANQYPYTASRTSLIAAVIPRWVEAGGHEVMLQRLANAKEKLQIEKEVKENIFRRGGGEALVISHAKDSSLNNKSLANLAKRWNIAEEKVVVKILLSDQTPRVVSFSMVENDLINFMKKPWVATGSDGTVGHPRKYASFTRKLTEYVFLKKVLTLEEVIRVSTSLPAEAMGLVKRGKIQKDFYADIIIFDKNNLKENATYDNPDRLSEGMIYVFVNGQLAIENGKFTGVLGGRALVKNEL